MEEGSASRRIWRTGFDLDRWLERFSEDPDSASFAKYAQLRLSEFLVELEESMRKKRMIGTPPTFKAGDFVFMEYDNGSSRVEYLEGGNYVKPLEYNYDNGEYNYVANTALDGRSEGFWGHGWYREATVDEARKCARELFDTLTEYIAEDIEEAAALRISVEENTRWHRRRRNVLIGRYKKWRRLRQAK